MTTKVLPPLFLPGDDLCLNYRCDSLAEVWLIPPDWKPGGTVFVQCRRCAEHAQLEYRTKLGEEWRIDEGIEETQLFNHLRVNRLWPISEEVAMK